MNVLAISGSLRTASRLAPHTMTVTVCDLVGKVPLFNPDPESAAMPDSVARLRDQIAAADALLIASPEYAHGVTGAMKNTLDWLVGCEAFVNKPLAVLRASPTTPTRPCAKR